MKVANGVSKAGWKPVLLLVPGFFLVFLVPGILDTIGFDRVIQASGGVITYTLANTWAGLLICVGGIALGYGGLEPSDIGFHPRRLPLAAIIVVGCWLLYSLAQLIAGLAVGNLAFHSTWNDPGILATIGEAVGFFLGNAPFEEFAFRGFLLVQFYLLLDGEWWQSNELARTATAVGGSSLIFTLLHLPAFAFGGIGVEMLGAIFVYAVLLCLVYLRTQNIFLAIGFHALANFSIPVFAVAETLALPIDLSIVWAIPAALIVIAWPNLPFSPPVAPDQTAPPQETT
jgi:hypothetical protein